ncbi:MAG: hypothetical protein COA78_37785 [Blastopirellula sp.]|nr:MAG: hypothetical protein COA78_37785 [Blastopirellula sp.]
MVHSTKIKSSILLMLVLGLASLNYSSVDAQAADEAKPAAEAKPAVKKRAQARGRLPNYYAKIVTEEQRKKIYGIQKQYAKQLAELQAQLAKIKADRDGEVEAVLSVDQLAKVKKLIDEAAAKRAAKAKSAKATSSK